MKKTISESDQKRLFEAALAARENAYAPYSGFRVGAALLSADGRIFCGANMENASYSVTTCAERGAFSAACAAGARRFTAICVLGGKASATDELCTPCGVCRQCMAEFCDGDFRILLSQDGAPVSLTLAELLPHSFGKETIR